MQTYIVRYLYTSWPSDQDYSKISKIEQTDLVNARDRADAIRVIENAEALDGCKIKVTYCQLAPGKGWL